MRFAPPLILIVFLAALAGCGENFGKDIETVRAASALTYDSNDELAQELAGARGKVEWVGGRFEKCADNEYIVGLTARIELYTRAGPSASWNSNSSFIAAAEDLRAGGNAAMYDGIALALSLLAKAKEADPSIKPVLFVLTDNETNNGRYFDDMQAIIKGLRVPIYAIGYEADFDELKRVSGLVEAATINAGEGEIRYEIGSLLNAQM